MVYRVLRQYCVKHSHLCCISLIFPVVNTVYFLMPQHLNQSTGEITGFMGLPVNYNSKSASLSFLGMRPTDLQSRAGTVSFLYLLPGHSCSPFKRG